MLPARDQLSVDDLASIAEASTDTIVSDIDVLADHNLLETEGSFVKLHPLVSDFYWKQARAAPTFSACRIPDC